MALFSQRFISAYNKIDKQLRAVFNLRPKITFSEAVRNAAVKNAFVRKYEDDLLDYARLRNAIVHDSDTEIIIAEPHASAVEKIEHIAAVLCKPPLALQCVAKKAVCAESGTPLKAVMLTMAEKGYSYMPVVKNGNILGVVSHKLIMELIAGNIGAVDLDAFISDTPVELTLSQGGSHYMIADKELTVDGALSLFTLNAKLQLMVLTQRGGNELPIEGVITRGDVPLMNKVLEDY